MWAPKLHMATASVSQSFLSAGILAFYYVQRAEGFGSFRSTGLKMDPHSQWLATTKGKW